MAGKYLLVYLFVRICSPIYIPGGYVTVVFSIHTGPLETLPVDELSLSSSAFLLELTLVTLQPQ